LDRYLLSQITPALIQAWRQGEFGSAADGAALLAELDRYPARRDIAFDTSVKGGFRFYTSGTTGQPQAFPVTRDSLLHTGLAAKLNELFNIVNHGFRRAVVALPMASNPMGMKYCFALESLGLQTIAAGVRTHNFTPMRVLNALMEDAVDFLVARPLEAEMYARLAHHRYGQTLDDVMGLLVTGEVVSPARLDALQAMYPNARVRSVYGLTELNSGLFSCSKGAYHFIPNGQTLIELQGNDICSRARVLFTVVRQDTRVVRYETGDIGRLVPHCRCEQGGTALLLRGRSADEVAPDLFLAELSDALRKEIGVHNVFATQRDRHVRILVKSSEATPSTTVRTLMDQHPHLDIQVIPYANDDQCLPLSKSCTVAVDHGSIDAL
jgi:phenylacetate-coenzyme A ligase PaaK-like adenylate-forming protein